VLSPYRTSQELALGHRAAADTTAPSSLLEELGLVLILVVILAVDVATSTASGVDAAIGIAALFVAHQAVSTVRRRGR
jgi:hypothetical protein